jgi:hypothetical protein
MCVYMSNKNSHRTALNAVSELLDYVAEDRAESAGGTMVFKDSPESRMHLLLDILLTDTWSMALRKVALATQEARPDIVFTASQIRSMISDGMPTARRRCGHFVRRLHRDESGLDLFWLMLAAAPGKPWTYNGWLPGFTDAFNAMELNEVEEGLLYEATDRYHRWMDIAGGFPTTTEDPFKAVTSKDWARAEMAQRDREKAERAAVARESDGGVIERIERIAAAVNRSPIWRKPNGEPVIVPEDDVQEVAGEVSAGVTVIAGEPKLVAPYKALASRQTELVMTPDLKGVRDALRLEFPHAFAAIDTMMVDLRPGEALRFRPFLLVGTPGTGKSRIIRRLGELLNLRVRRYDAAGSSDNAFAGTPKRWTSASACFPLQAIAETRMANPLVMIDEVDKSGTGSTAGSLGQALMPFLEAETARSYPDPCLEVECDLSCVNYAMTANDDTKLPSPLRDRVRVIRVPTPGREHIESLARSIMADLAVEMNTPPAFLLALAPDELAVIARAWGENGSVRKLKKIIKGTVTARDQHASRH